MAKDIPLHKHLLIGLPATGKTTFLAALWDVVETSVIENSLKLKKCYRNNEYLNAIRDSWQECNLFERTIITGDQSVSMNLYNSINEVEVNLVIPDLSGETYRDHWEERQWTKEFEEMATDITGVLLFIHPGKVIPPVRIDEAEKVLQEIGEDPNKYDRQEGVPEAHQIEWKESFSSTQVKIVELIQFISFYPNLIEPYRIAVIISAWDLVNDSGNSPLEWLESTLPLVFQYLISNTKEIDFRVFGISAQGAAYNEDNIPELLKYPHPCERIIVSDEDSHVNDITSPIKWLME